MSVTSEQGIESVVIFFWDCSVFLLWKFGKMSISGIVDSRKNFRSKHKYVGIKELTPAIVNEFIQKIIVHAPEKVNGKRVQKVDIVFNFVGEINFLSVTQPKRQGA